MRIYTTIWPHDADDMVEGALGCMVAHYPWTHVATLYHIISVWTYMEILLTEYFISRVISPIFFYLARQLLFYMYFDTICSVV